MTDKRIIYTGTDGGLYIEVPAAEARLKDEPEDDFIKRVIDLVVPKDATNVHVCNVSELSDDRTFRNAWEQGGDKLPRVNMIWARAVHMERIRLLRDMVLDELDKELSRALGSGDQPGAAAIEARRQVLRDLPDNIDLTVASNDQELRALWPSELKGSTSDGSPIAKATTRAIKKLAAL